MVFNREETINANRYESLRVRVYLCLVGKSKDEVFIYCVVGC